MKKLIVRQRYDFFMRLSCHKVILLMAGRPHCFYDDIYESQSEIDSKIYQNIKFSPRLPHAFLYLYNSAFVENLVTYGFYTFCE